MYLGMSILKVYFFCIWGAVDLRVEVRKGIVSHLEMAYYGYRNQKYLSDNSYLSNKSGKNAFN